jgi:hypothetical protein
MPGDGSWVRNLRANDGPANVLAARHAPARCRMPQLPGPGSLGSARVQAAGETIHESDGSTLQFLQLVNPAVNPSPPQSSAAALPLGQVARAAGRSVAGQSWNRPGQARAGKRDCAWGRLAVADQSWDRPGQARAGTEGRRNLGNARLPVLCFLRSLLFILFLGLEQSRLTAKTNRTPRGNRGRTSLPCLLLASNQPRQRISDLPSIRVPSVFHPWLSSNPRSLNIHRLFPCIFAPWRLCVKRIGRRKVHADRNSTRSREAAKPRSRKDAKRAAGRSQGRPAKRLGLKHTLRREGRPMTVKATN